MNLHPILNALNITRSIAFCLLIAPFSAFACSPGPDDNSCSDTTEPATTQQSEKAPSSVGNPISIITGNKYQREVDYASSGGVASLLLNRHYNSLSTQQDTGLGLGWRHSFDVRLLENISNNTIEVIQSNGRRTIFKLDGVNSKQYRGVSPQDGVISALGNNVLWSLNDGRSIIFKHSYPIKITYPGERSFALQYFNKHLRKVTDHNQKSLIFNYSGGNTALASFTQDEAAEVKLAGHLESVTLPDGSSIAYSYDSDHNLSRVAYPDGTSRVYHYENIGFPNHLTGITNRSGVRYATWGYTEEGRANLSTHADGAEKVTLDYRIPEQMGDIGTTVVTNSLGQKSTHTWRFYDSISQSLLLSSEGPGCSTCPAPNKTYTYTNRYQIKTATDTLTGTVLQYDYDKQGRTLSIKQKSPQSGGVSNRLVARYEYDGNLPRPTLIARPSINPNGEHITQTTYNDEQLPLTFSQKGFSPDSQGGFTPIERTTTLGYNQQGDLTTIDGPRTDVDDIHRMTYDANHRLININYADSTEEKFLGFDENGLVTKLQINDKPIISITYDANHNINAIEVNNKSLFKRQYNAESQLIKTTVLGKTTDFTYDDANRLIRETNDNVSKHYEWRLDGRAKKVTWFKDKKPFSALTYEYDSLNRLVAKKNLVGVIVKEYQYENGNHKVAQTKQGDFVLNYEYDAFNTLSAIANQTGQNVNFSSLFDTNKPISTTNAMGNKTAYGINDFGLTAYTQSPDSGLTTFAYNPAGQLINKTDANQETANFNYDIRNQLQNIHLRDDEISIEYDAETTEVVSSNTQKEQTTLNSKNTVKIVKQTINNKTFTTRYHYNERNKLVKKDIPGGKTINYEYENGGIFLGKLKLISINGFITDTPVVTINREQEIVKKQGASSASEFNSAINYNYPNQKRTRIASKGNRLESINTPQHAYRYGYNKVGKIMIIERDKKIEKLYKYDDKGQLTFALSPNAIYGYQYDKNGNRLQKNVNGLPENYQYDSNSNKLLQINNANQSALNISYRADGSLSMLDQKNTSITQTLPSQQRLEISYNSNGQPEQIDINYQELPLAQYQYNARGERISKTIILDNKKIQTQFLYENQKLSAELDSEGNITRQYLYHGQLPIVILEGDTQYAIHNNHLGAPVAVTDPKGNIIWQATYSPFGLAKINEDPDKNSQSFTLNLRLPGQYADDETGYYYNYYRYYDPQAGRYISSDPLGQRAGSNTYAYVKNDPIQNIDPLGLLLFAFDGTNNTDDQNELGKTNSDITNVVRFREAYDGDTGGVNVVKQTSSGHNANNKKNNYYFVTGAGKDDIPAGIGGTDGSTIDAALGFSMTRRSRYMGDLLAQHLHAMTTNKIVDTTLSIDIVGFSRGAATARMFANIVDDFIKISNQTNLDDAAYKQVAEDFYLGELPAGVNGLNLGKRINDLTDAFKYFAAACNAVDIDLNFIGLWDTVAHLGVSQANDVEDIRLGIPSSANYVSHAMAANEHREFFAGTSIHQNANTSNSTTRTEETFLGAHADIGGGYGEGDLSDVAFMWMVEQSDNADVFMDESIIQKEGWNIVTEPFVHSSQASFPLHGPDRTIYYLDGNGEERQKTLSGADLSTAKAETYFDDRYMETIPSPSGNGLRVVKSVDEEGARTLIGLVNIDSNPNADTYQKWLKDNYGLVFDQFDHSEVIQP